MSRTDFAHLHNHSQGSALDGLGTVEDYVDRAKAIGQTAIAITDHGVLCELPVFYHYARKHEVEPILGCEFYYCADASAKPNERYHVSVLARGAEGYKVLAELNTETHRQFHHKPLLDRRLIEQLGDAAQHLVVMSGCAGSVISRHIEADEMDEAASQLMWWREMFPHFYIEMMHHNTEFDRKLNAGLHELAVRYNVPWVITNDPHYVVKEDCGYHDTLLAIQTASDLDDPNRFRFTGDGYYLKSRAEMWRAFKGYEETIWKRGAAETSKVAKLCFTRIPEWEKRTWHIPNYPDVAEDQTPFQLLKKLAIRGLKERGLEQDPAYRVRTKMELAAIDEVGISDFLLITMDMVQWATENGIPVGPGRGSVCGTLVGYLIGIHKIDPVRYNLMFERFLNPARPRMPDIDTDFGPSRRAEVFSYLEQKYGIENVVHVAAYQRMQVKKAFKSLAKSYGVPFSDSNRLSKLLPDKFEDDGSEESYEWPKDFQTEVINKFPDLAAQLHRLTGLKTGVGRHPAGIIIADPSDHIRKLVPEMWIASSKKMCGQYDLDAAEEMGLMKQDCLGLRTLETIQEAVRIIEETTGEVLDPDSWVPDEENRDAEVYAMLAAGETAGVFQMEGPTNQRGIRQVGCNEFEDIVSTTSLYRTGAISAGFPKIFNENRKRGKEHIPYHHASLEAILGKTWGVVLYQEQVMEMAQMLAGFDMVQVDDIKEAIKHKKSELMKSIGPKFIKGCMTHTGMTREEAKATWNMIKGYSGYGYNRSHAVAYTFVSYQTARLKALYPAAFLTALLRTVEAKEKRATYLAEAVKRGLAIRRPDINLSEDKATAEEDGIRFGFLDLAGLGPAAAKKLIEGRPSEGYTSVEEVEAVVRNVKITRILAESGTLASIGIEGNDAAAEEYLDWSFTDGLVDLRADYESDLITPDMVDDGDSVVLIGEITKVDKSGKTKNGDPFATWHIRWDAANAWNVRMWSGTQKHWTYPRGSVVKVTGQWDAKWENVSAGKPSQIELLRRTPSSRVARSAAE